MKLTFGDGVTLKRASLGSDFSDFMFAPNLRNPNTFITAMVSMQGTNVYGDGVLCELTFTVDKDAEIGTVIPIDFDTEYTENDSEGHSSFGINAVNGAIKVVETPINQKLHAVSSLSGSGIRYFTDVLMGNTKMIGEKDSCDVNQDGETNVYDSLMLKVKRVYK